ncbi:MAG: translational machinery protein [Candidatus Melainabacteria bacterium]
MSEYHAVVWLDHNEARVFHINAMDAEKTVIHPDHPARHLHHKSGATGSGNAREDQHYYDEVLQALDGASAILVMGPGQAKLSLFKHAQQHHKALADKVLSVESSDHPSDGQVIKHARQYFVAADRMLPQI